MAHAVVVGGTGMLRGATLALARRHDAVSVVARSRSRLDRLVREAPNVRPVRVDYRETAALRSALAEAAAARGPVSLAVCWIHSDAPDAPVAAAEAIAGGELRWFDVVGSGDPGSLRRADRRAEALARFEGLRYRRVLLGGVREAGGFRWLTDEEISDGVLRAVRADRALLRVGEVRPG